MQHIHEYYQHSIEHFQAAFDKLSSMEGRTEGTEPITTTAGSATMQSSIPNRGVVTSEALIAHKEMPLESCVGEWVS